MVTLTRLNNSEMIINAELIEVIEETPDTVITLTTGRKFIVRESGQEVKNLIISYKRSLYKFDEN
ncbi:MAG: flagellar FlbD family protein [Lachnospiraceae bacterium]|nr:flagellar FlbD family protein [Lachnospiraceae bacterium]